DPESVPEPPRLVGPSEIDQYPEGNELQETDLPVKRQCQDSAECEWVGRPQADDFSRPELLAHRARLEEQSRQIVSVQDDFRMAMIFEVLHCVVGGCGSHNLRDAPTAVVPSADQILVGRGLL